MSFLLLLTLSAFALLYFLLYPYVLPRRQSLVAALSGAVVAAVVLSLPWPDKPMAAALQERGLAALGPYRDRWGAIRRRRQAERFEREAAGRFRGALPSASGGWLDEKNGLVWGPPLEIGALSYSEESWKRAVQACGGLLPAGYWALPTMAEFLKGRKNGLLDKAADMRGKRWLASVYISDMKMVMHGLFTAGPSKNSATDSAVGARCVARTAKAPEEGYLAPTLEEAVGL